MTSDEIIDKAATQLHERASAALKVYGGIDGDHHKAWAINQAVKSLLGDDYDRYAMASAADGYEIDEGTAP